MTIVEQIAHWESEEQPYYIGIRIYRLIYMQGLGSRPLSYYDPYLEAAYVPDHILQQLEDEIYTYKLTIPDTGVANLESPSQMAPSSLGQSVATRVSEHIETSATSAPLREAPIDHPKGEWKRYDHLKSRLYYSEDRQERYDIAKEIMDDVIPSLDRAYGRDVPEPSPPLEGAGGGTETLDPSTVQTVVDLMKKTNTLRSRISRLRSMITKATDLQDKQRYEQELVAKEAELLTINNQLGI